MSKKIKKNISQAFIFWSLFTLIDIWAALFEYTSAHVIDTCPLEWAKSLALTTTESAGSLAIFGLFVPIVALIDGMLLLKASPFMLGFGQMA